VELVLGRVVGESALALEVAEPKFSLISQEAAFVLVTCEFALSMVEALLEGALVL
jgi:hypothetical protein